MTSRFREEAISNNLNYLDQISDKFQLGEKKTNVLGFSQGAETASRWAIKNTEMIDSLILWSGRLGPEISLKTISDKLTIRQIMGKNDNWIQPESILKGHEEYFNGKHEINKALIKEFIKF